MRMATGCSWVTLECVSDSALLLPSSPSHTCVLTTGSDATTLSDAMRRASDVDDAPVAQVERVPATHALPQRVAELREERFKQNGAKGKTSTGPTSKTGTFDIGRISVDDRESTHVSRKHTATSQKGKDAPGGVSSVLTTASRTFVASTINTSSNMHCRNAVSKRRKQRSTTASDARGGRCRRVRRNRAPSCPTSGATPLHRRRR